MGRYGYAGEAKGVNKAWISCRRLCGVEKIDALVGASWASERSGLHNKREGGP